ncbi:MAG: winged helix family transcriptional regulator [Chloroflexi bacterium]|nr:MAG: winged helix family transcriptional regulator [Chloroflexota bacterium]
MVDTGPDHPVTYRQEIVALLFGFIRAGESSVVVASASMGKSRLVEFLMRKDAQFHYLHDATDLTMIVSVDCNRLVEFSTWALYELLLHSLLVALQDKHKDESLIDEFDRRHREVIIAENPLLAQRTVEKLIHILRRQYGFTFCLLLDEFDAAYQRLPAQALAGLRALRDADRYQLCYLLFTRQHPEHLRDPADCEGLYEQFSRNILYLQPYQPDDARRVIQQLAVRRGLDAALLSEAVVEELLALSGGHPGLMTALVSGLRDEPPRTLTRLGAWAQGLAKVHEECRKIYEGLRGGERAALRALVHARAPGRTSLSALEQKGLLLTESGAKPAVFSPLFATFLAGQTDTPPTGLQVDKQTGIVVVNGEAKPAFAGLLHDLFQYLYSRVGQVCSRDEIIFELYPDKEGDVESNTIDALIGRLRKEIEEEPSAPQYLKTVRGRGYRLVLKPEDG